MRRILLVEDVAAKGIAAVMSERAERRKLPIAGARWTTAKTIAEAEIAIQHAVATRDRIDAVILDLDLPDSGIEQTIAKIEAVAATWPTIFVVSNFASADARVRVLRAGAEDVMDKGRMQDVPIDFLERLWQACIRRETRQVEAARLK